MLVCHESPTRPWESIAADLFVFHGKDYVVTTDRYSNFLRSGPTVLKVKFRSYYQDEGTHRKIGHTQQAYVRQAQAGSSSYLLRATTLSILLVHQHTLNQLVKRRIV